MTDHPAGRLPPEEAAELDEAVRISKLSEQEDEEDAPHDPDEHELEGAWSGRLGARPHNGEKEIE